MHVRTIDYGYVASLKVHSRETTVSLNKIGREASILDADHQKADATREIGPLRRS